MKELSHIILLWGFCALVVFAREARTVWRDARFVWDGWRIVDRYIPTPRFLGHSCRIPDVGEGTMRPFCVPAYKHDQKQEAERLDRLVAELRLLGGNVAAPHVGVPLKLILWHGTLLLNPRRTSASGGQQWCEVQHPSSGQAVRVWYDKHTSVEYETVNGAMRALEVSGNESCELAFLLREITL